MKLFWLRYDKKWNYFRDYFANFGEIIILTKKNKKKQTPKWSITCEELHNIKRDAYLRNA